MTNEKKFFRCNVCGNIVGMIHDGGGKLVCCGQEMEMLVANTTDAAQEKHVPVAIKDGTKLTVEIGSVPHPMVEEHHIMWIAVMQGDKVQRATLKAGDAPKAEFCIKEDGAFTVYEYCNLHGLWKLEV